VDLFTAQIEARARRTASRYDDLMVPLMRKSAKVIVVAFGLVFVADNLDVDISSLLAGLGLGGLAFALAAQDTVKNLFGSLTVIVDKPFQVGDLVKLGDVQGTVEEVGFRSTRVRTASDSLVTVPNADVISSNVENLGARAWRRWLTRIGVTYETSPGKIEEFCEGIRDLARQHPDTKKDGIEVWANEFGPSAIEIVFAVHFPSTTWSSELKNRHGLLLDIMRLAERLGVEFAFPTQTIHVRGADLSRRPDGPPRGSQSLATSDPAPGDPRGT
jgi:MscS family membrane protein